MGTGRTQQGLYELQPLGSAQSRHAPNAEDVAGEFWRTYFLWRLAGADAAPACEAWTKLAELQPRLAKTLRGNLPELSRRIALLAAEGLRPRALLTACRPFWRPLAGYLEAVLENEDASPLAIKRCLEHVEALAGIL